MRVLVISPHRDDACFSLALTMLKWTRDSHRVHLLNCFTRSRYAPFSDAAETHANDRVAYVSALRRREDELFLRRAGVSRMDDLNLKDAPIRLHCDDDEVCFRTAAPSDTDKAVLKIRGGVERVIVSSHIEALIAPLALGCHIDHVTTRNAVLPFVERLPCAFYEDIPYAGRPGVFDMIKQSAGELAALIGHRLSAVLQGSPDDEQRKRSLAMLYASQINDEEAYAIAHFAERYSGHERVWATDAWIACFTKDLMNPHERAAMIGMRSA